MILLSALFSPQTTEEARIMIQNQVKAFLQLAEKRTSNFTSCRRSNWVIKEIRQKWDEMQERFINSITQDITYSQEGGLAHSELNKEIVARAWFCDE